MLALAAARGQLEQRAQAVQDTEAAAAVVAAVRFRQQGTVALLAQVALAALAICSSFQSKENE